MWETEIVFEGLHVCEQRGEERRGEEESRRVSWGGFESKNNQSLCRCSLGGWKSGNLSKNAENERRGGRGKHKRS